MPDSGNEAWEYLEERFGVSKMESFSIVERSGDYWLSVPTDEELEFETRGFRLLRDTGRGLKPTTYALQFFSERIDKNIFQPERDEVLQLLKRQEMIEADMDSEGYVALKYQGRIIGCGYFKNGVVSSRVPKGRAEELASIIEESL